MAERPRGRLPRPLRCAWPPILAAYVLGRRDQRDRPRTGRRRRSDLPCPWAIPGSSYTTVVSSHRRPDVRRHDARGARLRVGAHAGRAARRSTPSPRCPPSTTRGPFEDGVVQPARGDRVRRRRGGRPGSSTTSGTASAVALAQAFAVFDPADALRPHGRGVALADWGLRLATIWFFLAAFGIPQSLGNALLVQDEDEPVDPWFPRRPAGSGPSRPCWSTPSGTSVSRGRRSSRSASG